MAFPPEYLDEIRTRLPVSQVVGRRVQLKKQGREFVGLSPFNREKTPSFTVNDQKGFYHCFSSGRHGDIFTFLMEVEGLSFPEAVERLAAEAGLEVPRRRPGEAERAERRATLYDVNEAACAWFQKQLRGLEGRSALDYLHGRGLDDATAAHFRLGYAPAGNALRAALKGAGFDEEMLLEAGLLRRPDDGREPYAFFRDRVVFPITDRRGRVIGFGGRLMGDAKAAKYINSPDTPLFDKGRILYNEGGAREPAHRSGRLVAVEGYMDVIALHQAGIAEAVAPLGTALTEAHIEAMWRLAQEPILCLDGDDAGRRAAARAAERALPLLRPGCSLRFALLPEGEDPDSLVRAGGGDSLEELLARSRPLVDLLWEMEVRGSVDTPERRALVRQRLVQHAAKIADGSVQEYYRGEFETRLRHTFGGRYGRRDDRPRGVGQRPGSPRPSGRPVWVEPGLRSDGNTGVLELRKQQALIAAVLNHPAILEDVVEAFGVLEFASSELDRLRQEIIKTWHHNLESEDLKSHLDKAGLGAVVAKVLTREVYALAPFARPGAERNDVCAGWRQVFRLVHDSPRLHAELSRAERALAEDPSPRTLAYINALTRDRGAEEDSEDRPGEGAVAPKG